MTDWPKTIDEQYGGDPFKKLVAFEGKHYVFDEAALVEQEEMTYRSFEMDMRLKAADSLRAFGILW